MRVSWRLAQAAFTVSASSIQAAAKLQLPRADDVERSQRRADAARATQQSAGQVA